MFLTVLAIVGGEMVNGLELASSSNAANQEVRNIYKAEQYTVLIKMGILKDQVSSKNQLRHIKCSLNIF